jgi:hypothetical protein
MPNKRWVLLFAILLICPGSALSQRRTVRRTAPPPMTRGTRTAATDQYWAAQRSLEAAIQQLDAYLRNYPDGERAATAKQQLGVLRDLSRARAAGLRSGASRRSSGSPTRRW